MIGFVGASGSGKTTLIEKLIAALTQSGLRVGAVKRSHHDVDIDEEGKDSWRFRRAGSNPTMVTGGGFVGLMETLPRQPGLADLAGHFAGKADIILVEGFKGEAAPRFVFGPPIPPEVGDPATNPEVLGVITMDGAAAVDIGKPVFHRDQVAGIRDWIVQWLNQ